MKNKKTIICLILALVVIAISIVLIIVLPKGTATVSTNETSDNKVEEKVATEFLVDKVEIGDYVGLDISYENAHGTAPKEERTTLTGWRVIEKEGTGENGTVKVISAGNPLSYYHTFDADRDITPYVEMLNDLNKTITVEKASKEGFYENGFGNNNLTEVFSASEFVDMSKGIHAFGCASSKDGTETDGELEKLYAALSGKTMTMTEIDDTSDWPCSDKSLGLDENSEAYQLLANGGNYFIAGTKKASYTFWEMSYKGWIENSARVGMGVRPVVTLKAGIKTLQNADGVWELK